jgi:hypothetical protein
MKSKIWLKRIALVVIALWIGAWQEHIKIDINYILEQGALVANFDNYNADQKVELLRSTHHYMPYDYYFNHQPILMLVALKLGQLQKLKWVITFLSLVLFFMLNKLLLATFDHAQVFWKPLWMGYVGILGLAFAIFFIGRWAGIASASYSVAREMLGGLQSIVPTMIIYPLHIFNLKRIE